MLQLIDAMSCYQDSLLKKKKEKEDKVTPHLFVKSPPEPYFAVFKQSFKLELCYYRTPGLY